MAAMTAKEVLGSLCGFGSNCLWSPARLVAVPNTTGAVGWEADLLLLHPSGWVWEIEIKVSVADFRREFRTKEAKHKVLSEGLFEKRGSYGYIHTKKNKHVQKFFFAIPKEVYDKLREEDFPEYAGVIVVDPAYADSWGRLRAKIVRRAKNLPGAEKAGSAFRIRLLELAHARLWSYAYRDDSLLDIRES